MCPLVFSHSWTSEDRYCCASYRSLILKVLPMRAHGSTGIAAVFVPWPSSAATSLAGQETAAVTAADQAGPANDTCPVLSQHVMLRSLEHSP